MTGKRRDEGPSTWPAYVAVAGVAVLPVLELLAANTDGSLAYGRLIVHGAVSVAIAVAVLAGFARWRPERARRTAVLLVPLLWWFFHMPVINGGLDRYGADAPDLAAWAIVGAFTVALLLPFRRVRAVQSWVIVVVPLLLVVPIVDLVTTPADDTGQAVAPDDGIAESAELRRPANVWFFLADGYARADVVEEQTGLDVGPFVDDLTDRDFVVSAHANANYPVTFLSIASTLSMEYLADDTVPMTSLDPFHARMRGDNAVRASFAALGYASVHAHSGFLDDMACTDLADLCLGDGAVLTETDWAFLNKTPLGEVVGQVTGVRRLALTADPEHVVAQVIGAEVGEPYFVFAHLLAPHQPYVRRADCSLRQDVTFDIGASADPDGYAGAAACLNRQLVAAFDAILARDPDAVIVLQGDHGTKFAYEPGQRMPILSAIRLPEACRSSVPDDLSSVNTFRVVFGCLTTAELPLLENRAYWVEYRETHLTDITTEVWGTG